jgi:hypothetical protein
MPAEAGIQGSILRTLPWLPACAGVTIPEGDLVATFANLRNEVLGGSEGRLLAPIIEPIVVRGTEPPMLSRRGLFCGGYFCCRPTPGQVSHAVSFGMFFVHRSCRDIT